MGKKKKAKAKSKVETPLPPQQIDAHVAQVKSGAADELLDQAIGRTRAQLAETTGMTDEEISSLENFSDTWLSTLRKCVEEDGGTLRITVNYDIAVEINTSS